MTSSELLAIALAVMSAIPGVLAILAQRQRDKDDIKIEDQNVIIAGAQSVTGSAVELMKTLRTRMDKMQAQLDRQDEELRRQEDLIRQITDGVGILTDQLQEENITPKWTLEEIVV